MKKTYSVRLEEIDIQMLDRIGKEIEEELKKDGHYFKVSRSDLIGAAIFDYAKRHAEKMGKPLGEYVIWAVEEDGD